MSLSDATHADKNHGAAKEAPWGLERTPPPASGSLAGVAAVAPPVEIDAVVAFARGLNLPGRFTLDLPSGLDGVWTIGRDSMSNDGNDPAADRTIHIDRCAGDVLADVRYADDATYAKAMAWGIAFHEGDLGLWNVALNTLFRLSVLVLSGSGVVMWPKRRPSGAGRLAGPPRPQGARFWTGASLVVLALRLAFPMAGAAILAMSPIDATVLRAAPALKRALS